MGSSPKTSPPGPGNTDRRRASSPGAVNMAKHQVVGVERHTNDATQMDAAPGTIEGAHSARRFATLSCRDCSSRGDRPVVCQLFHRCMTSVARILGRSQTSEGDARSQEVHQAPMRCHNEDLDKVIFALGGRASGAATRDSPVLSVCAWGSDCLREIANHPWAAVAEGD